MPAEQKLADIAVIGMGCRFPGDATSPENFYQMLLKGRSGQSEVPHDRFNIEAYWHPSYDRKGTIVSRGAHFLSEDVALFDAPARAMDPQHRLLLEITYECLENAGIPLHKLAGSDTSCFVGGFTREYDTVTTRDLPSTLLYATTGNGLTMMSNRLSWFYDLRGPSMTLDTACSSSLVALKQACESIRSSTSDCRQSIVAGSNLILIPDQMTTMNPLHFLSPDSQCYSFDDRANGYVRGEGVGVILLKHIDDAIRDGDCIRAVIRNVEVNQDGKTPGITLPSSEAQVALMRKTYESAGLTTDATGYFEAHGTGTAAGDPLEVSAIASVFQRALRERDPLYIGSVKPNIGHLEAGAGMAGLIKTILALESGVIPPNINFKNPNPRLGLQERNLRVVTEPTSWPVAGLRRASVNSFGYGGTNAHCIIDDAHHYLAARGIFGRTHTQPAFETKPAANLMSRASSEDSGIVMPNKPATSKERPLLFVLSAPEQSALPRLAASQANHLQDLDSININVPETRENLAHTWSERRSIFQWRTSLVADSASDLVSQLDQVSKGTRAGKEPGILFSFTGQGAQWFAMGRELLQFEVFLESVAAADRFLLSIGSTWSALQELGALEKLSKINEPRFSQPLCTVLQVALVDLLAHWGVTPTAVIGHSSGEIAAGYALGALSSEDCWQIAFHRGRLAEEIQLIQPALNGGMLAVGLSKFETEAYIEKLTANESDIISIACVNSPQSVTVSGDTALLDRLAVKLEADKVFVRKLAVKNAYHSRHMNVIAEQYRQSLQNIKTKSGHNAVSMFSSVTGEAVKPDELHADYWVRNMVEPVLFYDALQSALQGASGKRRRRGKASAMEVILEIGPHAALSGPIRQSLQQLSKVEEVSYISMLRRKQCAQQTAITAMGFLWSRGTAVQVHRVNNLARTPKFWVPLVSLPKYPWNHTTRYWHESAFSKSLRFRHSPRTDLLGQPVNEFTWSEPTWKNYVRLSELPWISDHTIRGNDVFPAAGMICAAIEGAHQISDQTKALESFDLQDVVISRALIIPADDPGVEVFTRLRPRRHGAKDIGSWFDFTFTSLDQSDGPERTYTEHCSGAIKVTYRDTEGTVESESTVASYMDRQAYKSMEQTCNRIVTATEHYNSTAGMGIVYGPTFQGIKSIKAGNGQAVFVAELQDTQSVMPANFEYPFVIHPTLLDAAIQSAYQGLTHKNAEDAEDAVVPTGFGRMRVAANIPRNKGTQLMGYVSADWISPKDCTASIKLGTEDWSCTVLELNDCVFTGLGDSTGADDSSPIDRRLASKVVWRPAIDLLDPSGKDAQRILGGHVESPETLHSVGATCTQAAAIFIQRAIKKLTPELEASLTGHWALYVEWLHKKYNDALNGKLPYQTEANEDWLSMTYDREDQFLAEAGDRYPADVKLLYAVGSKLTDIISGSQPPLPIMLVDDMLTKVYADSIALKSGLGMFREYFDHLGHKKPDISVLEIGGGTGSVTLPVLDILGGKDGRSPRLSSYTFTDVSTGWFEKAQETFRPWAHLVRYQKLDIEQDPVEQGFEPESFDVISASNVLHATKRLDVTLRNCYKLLKPGGKIVIGELTACPDHFGVIFGTLPGWWLSEDGRTGGPVISQQQWEKCLRDSQFTGLDMALAAEDVNGSKILSTLVSTKPATPPETALRKAFIVSPEVESALGTAIVDAVESDLRTAAVECVTLSLDEAAAAANDDQLNAADVVTICLVEAVTPVFARPSQQVYMNVQTVITRSRTLFWVACNTSTAGVAPPEACAISGLLRTARSENPSLRLFDIHLQARSIEQASTYGPLVRRTVQTVWQTIGEEHENEIFEINNILSVPRLVDDEPLNKLLRSIGKAPKAELQTILQRDRPLKLQMSRKDKVDGLYFADDDQPIGTLPHDSVEVEVKAGSINAVDVEVVTAKTPGLHLGHDVAGVVSKVGSSVRKLRIGDRVAFAHRDAFCTHLRVSQDIPCVIPDQMDMHEAAAVPFVYTAAYYGIFELAHVSKGDKVLVTQASGGLGHALILLAQLAGADVYATAGTPEKRQHLQDQFRLDANHVFDSASATLIQAVKRLTDGRGFDTIFNRFRGERFVALCDCVAPFGHFVNFNQQDVRSNASVQLRSLGENISFASVDMQKLLQKAPHRASKILERVFWLLGTKAVSPISPTVFDYSDLKDAFTAAQDPNVTGKVVLQLTSTSMALVIPRDVHPFKVRPDATYAISGGLGGVGRALACFLADNGARHIALLSRNIEIKGDAICTMQYLEDLHVNVKVIACDVSIKEAVRNAIASINSDMPPIRGVIHGAMHLRDGLYENMTHEQWVAGTKPKIEGTWNLHEMMPQDVDFFIMLSSIAGICGNPGQPNYAAGNSYQDAMSHYRRSLGLQATTIDLGAIGGFGWLEDNKAGSTFADVMQRLVIQPDELFTLFKSAATGYTSGDNLCPTQLVTGIGTGGLSAAHVASGGKTDYFWLKMQGRFAYLRQLDAHQSTAVEAASDDGKFKTALAAAVSLLEAAIVVQGALAAKLAKAMMIAAEEIDVNRPVSAYGVDSLVAAELRNWCVQEVKAVISVFEFLKAVPISTLAFQIAEKSTLLPETVERAQTY